MWQKVKAKWAVWRQEFKQNPWPFWHKLSLLLLIATVVGLIIFTIFFLLVAKDLPAPNQVVRQSGFSTRIYDRHGVLLYDFFQDQRREPITLDQIDQDLINATIAVEDKEFYHHKGFDFLTILRVPYYYLTQKRLVGGSTLTQQLTKMMLLSNERKVMRKFRELILSMQIEEMFTKEEILQMYLNEAPYGGNIVGVSLAAKNFFQTSASDLTVAQSAFLAGLPQSPSRYSPYLAKTDEKGNLLWKERAIGVLRRMNEDGYISSLAYQEALAELDSFVFPPHYGEIKAPHFVFYVDDLLREMYGDEMVDAGGFQVQTSLDWSLQASVEAIVKEEVEAVESMDISNGAALVLAPKSGEILAMVGSKDFYNQEIDGQFNVAANKTALRQPGSSIKPLVYLALLEQRRATAATVFADVPTTFQANEKIKAYTPRNYDGKFRGPVSLRQSLGNSYNIPAVKALAMVGLENFLSFAHQAGLSTFAPSAENLQKFGLALSLGGGEVRMIELASTYAGFANQGYKVEPVAILEVKDVKGQVLYRHTPVQGEKVFDEKAAFIINDILSDNEARKTAFGANSLLNTKRPIAVKTGTTNNLKDNWAIGWSQEFLVHTWVGNNDGTPMKNVASGITGASPIWRKIVNRLIDLGYQTPAWEIPAGVKKEVVDAISGYPPHDDFPTKEEYFVDHTLGVLPDPIHSRIAVCKGQNKIATDAQKNAGDVDWKEFIVLQEEDPVSEDGVNRWQIGINNWASSFGGERYQFPTEMCGDNQDVSVALYDLQDKATTELDHLKFRVQADSGAGIEKIELYLNDKVREEKTEVSRFEVEWRLDKGVHKIKAKAYSRDGKTAESFTYRVGVSGAKVEDE